MSEFMDIDGPEFIADVNNQIESYRANSLEGTSDNYAYSQYANDIEMSEHFALENFNEIAVLDTNFLLVKLGFIDTLLQLANKNPGSLLIILPWIVIKELDGLKERTGEVSISARKAMRFLQLKLGEKTISLRGQKMDELLNKNMKDKQKNDDRILDCCMYFQQVSNRTVSLLSNDRNLAIKAMVHGVESISAEFTARMEQLLNKTAGLNAAVATLSTNKSKKPKQLQKPVKQAEDYSMDIDDYYPKMSNIVDDDIDMMHVDNSVQSKRDSSKSRWAKDIVISERSYTTKYRPSEGPAFLDNDPTLTAPKRPFRPGHVSYDWAREKYNQEN